VKQPIKNISVIGTGVIGAGWIIRFLFNQKKICVYDPQLKQKKFLENEIKRAKPILKKIYKKNITLQKILGCPKSIQEAVKNADLIQENAPENEILKIKIVKEISKYAKKMQELGIKPEMEAFEMGHLWFANQLYKEGLVDSPPL
jgi:carnitine 3-dehydrogenase